MPCLHQDPREYFDCQQANALKALGDSGAGMKPTDCSLSYEEAYIYLAEQISEVKLRGLNDPVVHPEIALKVEFKLRSFIFLSQNLFKSGYSFLFY